jgi:hypothetical protein
MGTGSQPSWWEALHRIKAPVLLICGEWDEKFCAINQKVHNLLPSSKIEVVKQAGHTVHVDHQEGCEPVPIPSRLPASPDGLFFSLPARMDAFTLSGRESCEAKGVSACFGKYNSGPEHASGTQKADSVRPEA